MTKIIYLNLHFYKLIRKKITLHFYYTFRHFLDFLILWNSLFYSLKRLHISFSFTIDSSCFLFFFFQQFIFFSHLSPLLSSFFDPFFHLFLFDLVQIINIYKQFLFVNVCFITYCFIVFQVFLQGTFQLFFVFLCFEDDVKITLQIKTTFLCRTINLWKNVGISILKCFCSLISCFLILCSCSHPPLKKQLLFQALLAVTRFYY